MARSVSIAFNNPWKDFSFLNTSLMILNTFPHSTMQHIYIAWSLFTKWIMHRCISQKSPYESNVPREFHAPTANLISAYLYIKPKLKRCCSPVRHHTHTFNMAVAFQRNQVGMKVTGTNCTVPSNPKAKLMYYLNCMATVCTHVY